MMAAEAEPRGQCESTIAVAIVRALVDAVAEYGLSRADFLSAARLDAAALEGMESRLSGAHVYALCELALHLTNDPAFGLHWAERMNQSALVPLSNLIAHAPTLRHAFESIDTYHRLLTDRRTHEVVEHGDRAIVRMRVPFAPPRMQRFAAEMMMSFFFRLLRSFDRDTLPECVRFQHAAPDYRAEYTRIFAGAECFEQPFTGIVFHRALLGRPSPHKDDDVHDALRSLAERRLLRIMQRTPYAQRIRDYLVREGETRRCDMLVVARALGMSARSLRRRLVTEGKTYNEVVNEALAFVAMRLLRRQQSTIQEAAYEMGFSDPRGFHRAFKRWTGMTPAAYRDTARC